MYEIEPYVGVNPIQFGMSIEQVRRVLSAPVEPFWKSQTSELPTDAFDSLGIHVYYKQPGVCTAVEFGSTKANPTLQNRLLLQQPYSEMKQWISLIDPDLTYNSQGLTSFKLGVGFYVPALGIDRNALITGIIVFEKSYYDD